MIDTLKMPPCGHGDDTVATTVSTRSGSDASKAVGVSPYEVPPSASVSVAKAAWAKSRTPISSRFASGRRA
ncbi:hypothetical protein OK006_0213 [Actinobacteria bacterium OK006]|nr:hypothetical protein OK006_0213 [Actinobacteria bacterium OK006]